ncbi:DUF3017 domain-containing protein [Streptomyces sp. NPDC047515]|uniref:DUF3017 domain-containing protein n=1 Tax=Streptomyces sp. NPDC047515 TaxID=3155380 RepID=UPI0033EFE59B
MGAGTSPADPAAEADRTSPVPSDAELPAAGAADAAVPDRAATREGAASKGAAAAGAVEEAAARGPADVDADTGADMDADADVNADVNATAGAAVGADEGSEPESGSDSRTGSASGAKQGSGTGSRSGSGADSGRGEGARPQAAPREGARPSRRFPSLTRDTARPEGGGRAASGDAPAPARQWPLLAVLCTAGIGLLIVAVDPFAEAFRIGTILIGAALIGGAVLRLVVPSVGMLAVRSRFTDLVTYGLLGFLIVMLALVAQPKPWLDMPFLEDAVHFTIR